MPISKIHLDKVSWYCLQCGEKLTAFENSSGVAEAKCKKCGTVMKRHTISPEVTKFEAFPPNGDAYEQYCIDEDLFYSKDPEWWYKMLEWRQ